MTRIVLAGLFVAAVGCTASTPPPPPPPPTAAATDEVAEQRAKLSAEDRALVDAQEWCVVSTSERLGGMGPPIKLEVSGTPVFVCCGGCKKKALADPDKTLATLAALQARKKKT